MPKRKNENNNQTQQNIKRRKAANLKIDKIKQDVCDSISSRFFQEFYEHVLAENKLKSSISDQFAPGGVSISIACSLFFLQLKSGDPARSFEETYGISDSSMSRIIHWILERVSYNQYLIKFFFFLKNFIILLPFFPSLKHLSTNGFQN